MKLSEILGDIGSPVAYYPGIARAVGSVKAGIFFSQLYYWREKGKSDDGWIYKSVEELESETGLSYKEQRAARASLVALGVLEEHHNREEHKLYFRLNLDGLDTVWNDFQTAKKEGTFPKGICPKVSSHLPKSKVPPAQKSVGTCPKVISYRNREYAESTTESTQRVQKTDSPPEKISNIPKEKNYAVPDLNDPLTCAVLKAVGKFAAFDCGARSPNDVSALSKIRTLLDVENHTVADVQAVAKLWEDLGKTPMQLNQFLEKFDSLLARARQEQAKPKELTMDELRTKLEKYKKPKQESHAR